MSHEWWKKHRPRTLGEMHGQKDAVKIVQSWLDKKSVPHAVMLTGSSGTGKTTLARILRKELGCNHKCDYEEVNCALVDSPIDKVREIDRRMRAYPMGGKVRICLLDEIQSWVKSGFSQQALLKMLEDTQDYAYFMLATTDPSKIIPTVRNRCSELKLKPLSGKDMTGLLKSVAEEEGFNGSEKLLQRIIEVANGSARLAVSLLEKAASQKTESEQLDTITVEETNDAANVLVKLLTTQGTKWPAVAKVLEQMDDSPEGFRNRVTAYAGVLLLRDPRRAELAYKVINALRDPIYEKAVLIAACYEIVS